MQALMIDQKLGQFRGQGGMTRQPFLPIRRLAGRERLEIHRNRLVELLLSIGVWQYSVGVRPSEAGVLVTSAHTDDPRGTVMVYSTPEQDVAVVWVFGLND